MSNNRLFIGKVIKKSSDKTVAVVVESRNMHKKYGRYVLKTKKYLVHDEDNSASVGAKVKFKYFRPISKRKSYILVK